MAPLKKSNPDNLAQAYFMSPPSFYPTLGSFPFCGQALKVGDEVALISKHPSYNDGPFNPIWGQNGQYIVGKITKFNPFDSEITINWENGENNTYREDKSRIVLVTSEMKKRAIPVPKIKKIDLKPLDALVLAKESKDEIVAVIKQHSHKDKMFDEWGLGQVIEYGRGMSFLFYGAPGTGKTWAAHCISKATGSELLTIGAAEIQTSEPGGANRNIQQAFATAAKEDKVLFIDECDGLISSRNDVGMILGAEINTLLTEIEKFEGVCILATNRIANLDEALERRISLIVEFPEPDEAQREQIWKKLLPDKFPLGSNVGIDKLAAFKLTGGQIKNCILAAARLAVAVEAKKVDMAFFMSAIDRVMASKNLMGQASRYHQIRVREDFVKR